MWDSLILYFKRGDVNEQATCRVTVVTGERERAGIEKGKLKFQSGTWATTDTSYKRGFSLCNAQCNFAKGWTLCPRHLLIASTWLIEYMFMRGLSIQFCKKVDIVFKPAGDMPSLSLPI